MKKPHNPPAFPQDLQGRRGDDPEYQVMTLRDWLAGQLAPVIYKQFNEDGTVRQFPEWRDGIANEAYKIADAMLAERERDTQ